MNYLPKNNSPKQNILIQILTTLGEAEKNIVYFVSL